MVMIYTLSNCQVTLSFKKAIVSGFRSKLVFSKTFYLHVVSGHYIIYDIYIYDYKNHNAKPMQQLRKVFGYFIWSKLVFGSLKQIYGNQRGNFCYFYIYLYFFVDRSFDINIDNVKSNQKCTIHNTA